MSDGLDLQSSAVWLRSCLSATVKNKKAFDSSSSSITHLALYALFLLPAALHSGRHQYDWGGGCSGFNLCTLSPLLSSQMHPAGGFIAIAKCFSHYNLRSIILTHPRPSTCESPVLMPADIKKTTKKPSKKLSRCSVKRTTSSLLSYKVKRATESIGCSKKPNVSDNSFVILRYNRSHTGPGVCLCGTDPCEPVTNMLWNCLFLSFIKILIHRLCPPPMGRPLTLSPLRMDRSVWTCSPPPSIKPTSTATAQVSGSPLCLHGEDGLRRGALGFAVGARALCVLATEATWQLFKLARNTF